MKIDLGFRNNFAARFGSWENFILEVQKGNVPKHSIISKFAENPAIASATPADIWDYGATEPTYTFSTTADIDTISSSSDSDTIEMAVYGLDADYVDTIQLVTLTGRTKKTLDTPLIRVYRAFNNNGTDLVGNVYIYPDTAITNGVPNDTTKVRAYVSAAEQQTLMGIYTTPANTTGYYLGLTASVSRAPVATNCIFTGKARVFNGIFRTQVRFNLTSTGSSYVIQPGISLAPFPPKTDFVARGEVTANDTGVSATLDLLLVQD